MLDTTNTMNKNSYLGPKNDGSLALGSEVIPKAEPPISKEITGLLFHASDTWKDSSEMPQLIPDLLHYLADEWRYAKDVKELTKHISFIINLFEKNKSNGEFNSHKVLQYMMKVYKFRILDQDLKIRIQKYLGTYKPLIEPPKEDTSIGFVSMDTYDLSEESGDEFDDDHITRHDEDKNDDSHDEHDD
jgi:hypothetical protein